MHATALAPPKLVTTLTMIMAGWRVSQVPLAGAKVREKIRHFEENLAAGAQREQVPQARAVPQHPPQPAHLPPSGRVSRLARPITPDEAERAA
jgi:hypothetical protein